MFILLIFVLFNAVASEPSLISIRYKLKWDALWEQGASLEKVSAVDRKEYVDEALLEIASKMKRKHQNKSFKNFVVRERDEEIILVEYPDLKSEDSENDKMTDEELKQIALKLLTTGVVNTINIIRDGDEVDVFNIEEYQKIADENYERTRAERR